MTRNVIINFLKNRGVLFPQELPRVLNRNYHKDKCADKISLIPADQNSDPKGDVIAALLRREKQFRIITQLNCDSGHGVFQRVPLSPVTLNRIL